MTVIGNAKTRKRKTKEGKFSHSRQVLAVT